jgi:pimeloyl-ACP methyl ester carboxylesterase
MRATLVVAGLVLVVLVGGLWLGQRRLIYLPDASAVPPASTVLAGAEDVTVTTADGLALGAYLVHPHPSSDRRMAVLLAPGNGGNRLGRVPLARALAAQGLTVLLMDYRGYGGNPGRPTQAGLFLDVRAAWAFLARAWPENRIVYFGESLGCAVVADLATEHPPAGLFLRSPFVDLAAAGRHNYPYLPVGLLLRDRLPVAEKLAGVRAPTVVLYGTADSIVPAEQSREVAERAGGVVDVIAVEGADHNDPVLFDSPTVVSAVVALANRVQAGILAHRLGLVDDQFRPVAPVDPAD